MNACSPLLTAYAYLRKRIRERCAAAKAYVPKTVRLRRDSLRLRPVSGICFAELYGLPSRSPRARGRRLVEAAGVEPASEIAVSRENPCSVRFRMISPQALRTDKMRRKLVR